MPIARTWAVCLSLCCGPIVADEVRVLPAAIVLDGPEAQQQLRVEGAGGVDRTASSTYRVDDPTVARVDAQGLVEAVGDGLATVEVVDGPSSRRVAVQVRGVRAPAPVQFADQVVPIFTRAGCNGGGCHGKSSGQNGFRLSLLGFEPDLDYETLVREGRGRRLFPASPGDSLLLQKATARVPHGGGRRIDPGSVQERLILRWIGQGMPAGARDTPKLAEIRVDPPARAMKPGHRQQLLVRATYADGRTEDVTRLALFQSNDPSVAGVDPSGQVTAGDSTGRAAVMARYRGQVAVFEATLPAGDRPPPVDFAPTNFVDRHTARQWDSLGLEPSPEAQDAEFIRRARLDITGTLPTAAEARTFDDDPDPAKRLKLIDRLLDTPAYSAYFANFWAEILRNQRENKPQYQNATYRFHDWIRRSLAENLPFDRFARAIVAASGSTETSPAVGWYRRLKGPEAFVDDTAQVFLGTRLQCARCHHHPYERWSQDDYYGFAAYFARIGRKASTTGAKSGRGEEVIFARRSGSIANPRTGRKVAPRPLGGVESVVSAEVDPRQDLAGWLVSGDNPYFARAVVNRYWGHFFGRGIVEPLDDLRLSNPPTNPELLDALADDFRRGGFDLKRLIRTLCGSRTYGLSSATTRSNARDHQSFARRYPRRLAAEVLLDAVSDLTGAPTAWPGLPAGTRAIELPDDGFPSAFLDGFGRPRRESACACERVDEPSLGQSLILVNSPEVQAKLNAPGGRARALVADPRPLADKLDALFWAAFARPADSGELAEAARHVEAHRDDPSRAYEDILWALINAREFQFND